MKAGDLLAIHVGASAKSAGFSFEQHADGAPYSPGLEALRDCSDFKIVRMTESDEELTVGNTYTLPSLKPDQCAVAALKVTLTNSSGK